MGDWKDCHHFGEKKYHELTEKDTPEGIEKIIIKKGYEVEIRKAGNTYECTFQNEENLFNYVLGIVKGSGYNPTAINNGTPENSPTTLKDDALPQKTYTNLIEYLLKRT